MPHEKEPLFRAIAEWTYDWESYIDASGQLAWVNGAVFGLTGYTPEECAQMADYPLGLVHPDDRETMRRRGDDAAAGGRANDLEFRILRKDGLTRWGAVSYQPLVDDAGVTLGYRASVRDIQRRKELEARLHALREEAEVAARAKTELLANVSHELRTPAHAVAGFAELLLDERLEPKARRYVEIVRDQAGLLARQIDDLLDMASLETGGVRIERRAYALDELVLSGVESLELRAKDRGVSLSVEVEPSRALRLLGDRPRVAQILRNLVENAIKYTDHGSVEVHVRVAEEGPTLVLEVKDTGIGIAPEVLPVVTQPFVRGNNEARARGGKGLGLAVADRLANAMGGSLRIESELGVGTVAHVELPTALAEDAGGQSEPPGSERAASILVVDDTDVARELLVHQLARLGQTAVEAASGREALVAALRQPFELVLLDRSLPDRSGEEVALALVAQAQVAGYPRPRIVAVTAALPEADDAMAQRAFDDVLAKPLSLDDLRAALRASRGAPHGSEPLDAAVVRDLMDGPSPSMLSRYVGRVDAELPAQLARLDAQLSAQDLEGARATLHALVGVFLVVGARGTAEEARALSRALDDQGFDGPAALRSLEQSWRASFVALSALAMDR